ncbi:cytochrome c biogenesis protein DipZ [Candidatus Roizmanbacteria bacterium]|nr:cytochrome c biogenesis protein DipZ [Candidatus Roizmanbacteria bacterium]
MIILLVFAFLSGLVTILAPCIWPLLPIILSASTSGGKRKPLGITLGIIISFAVFTLTISYIVKIIPFDPEVLRYVAVGVIGVLGLMLVVPPLGRILEGYVSMLSGRVGGVGRLGKNQKEGFTGGLLVGLALGIVWTPCAGPILATIATLAATRAVTIEIVFVTLVYVIGVGIPLFFFAAFGQQLFTKSKRLNRYTGRIQQIFGVVMILTALSIATGYDRVLQAKLLDAIPSYSRFLNQLESNDSVKNQLDRLRGKEQMKKEDMKFPTTEEFDRLPKLQKAPEFVGINNWLNTDEELSLEKLRGKVVLVDFWTYTCINCIRTFPHLKNWYETYKEDGFVIVGVHTPEFEFEKKTENVEMALKQYGLTYPVAQDNDYETWRAYDNHYWPAHYLVDKEGYIRYFHFGEGKYDETEKAIRELIAENGTEITKTASVMEDQTPKAQQTPETYLGLARMERLAATVSPQSGINVFPVEHQDPALHHFKFEGTWNLAEEYAESGENATLTLHFLADKVFLVITPRQKSDQVRVLLDGKSISSGQEGIDVVDGLVVLDEARLYELVDLQGNRGEHILRLEFPDAGTQVFAFTFG